MITAAQLKAARALLGKDQKTLAEASGLSLPTIQRMEASDGTIRGNVDSLMKLVAALDGAGIWPLLEAAIEGNIVADFPLCNKSFNCSYSGHDL